DQAHHPPRLVSALQEVGRAACARRVAWQPDRQPRAGAVGLVALWPGADARPYYRSVQLPPALQAYAGRAGAAVVSSARNPLSLVRASPYRVARRRRLERRRDGLARQRHGALALVFHYAADDLLPDRPAARETGDSKVLPQGLSRHAR